MIARQKYSRYDYCAILVHVIKTKTRCPFCYTPLLHSAVHPLQRCLYQWRAIQPNNFTTNREYLSFIHCFTLQLLCPTAKPNAVFSGEAEPTERTRILRHTLPPEHRSLSIAEISSLCPWPFVHRQAVHHIEACATTRGFSGDTVWPSAIFGMKSPSARKKVTWITSLSGSATGVSSMNGFLQPIVPTLGTEIPWCNRGDSENCAAFFLFSSLFCLLCFPLMRCRTQTTTTKTQKTKGQRDSEFFLAHRN